jgi:hypothetical protein
MGRDLVEPGSEQIFIEHMVDRYLSPEVEARANRKLETTLDVAQDAQQIESRIVEVDTLKEGILAAASKADLLLLGASKEGVLEQSFFGGLPVEIVISTAIPTILVRGREKTDRFGLKRFWEMLTDVLPTLTLERQAAVFRQMRESAQPSVDFFVLITLAAMIAGLGLLQNSAAVIIGAMLVAPLMSPILAMAMSLVKGDLQLLVVAAEATTKGIVLAIIVGVIMVIISPIDSPTSEIMGRTQPNVLDLMVALA